MNKAITEGLALMPPAFVDGLGVWSSGNGTSGTATYAGAGNAAIVAADQDFGGCLELLKTQTTQYLRWMGQVPVQPGCYLRIRAKVKAVSGNLPAVRIAATPIDGLGAAITGLTESATPVTLTSYGEVVTIEAIVGSGNRTGNDMVWGTGPSFAHVGLDLTGPDGGTIRIDDIEVEDATEDFHRTMMDWIDVRDYGAIGDGVTDDTAAFEAADAASTGEEILVSDGTYYLADHVTFESRVRFEGTVTMPVDKRLTMTRNYDLPSYIDAFGDEAEAFKRALAVLFNFSDHAGLDMCGRRIELDGPLDVQAAVANKTTHAIRKVIRNGEIAANANSNWDLVTASSDGTYATSNPLQLSGVANVANIEVGSLVEGLGVGREVYVLDKNVGAQTLTLSKPLFDAVGTQPYTFTRFKYLLDFSGFASISRLVFDDVDFRCEGRASAVMLPPAGLILHFRDCFFTKPKDRGITSIGSGCQGLLVDRCQFISNEQSVDAQDRTSIGLNTNANDVKLRDNRAARMGTWAVIGGSGGIISGNHFFQGDDTTNGSRKAGLVLTQSNVKTLVVSNYIDNCFVEWTNEHDDDPDHNNEASFGGLTVTGNTFTANDVAAWFRWFVIKPHGSGHYIQGLNLSGNVFKALNGNVDRVEAVDTTHATLDLGRMRNCVVEGNTFNGIDQWCMNPVSLEFTQSSFQQVWTCDFSGYLPFGGRTRRVQSVVAESEIFSSSLQTLYEMPYVSTSEGASQDQVTLHWSSPCSGAVYVTTRMDNPT
ncbi:glycosyl hydrolase family 28-related protein [Actibacterium pelagium]|uniref:Rhamnogalacturonase A/B/Epimerase-like pectate lyase domain-containing protein n=1 Tax=Actibacterium pelagium TaxID=2029103 RepID=A0A917AI06_9RHOB|nr:glycosyl hydrolase family 28-related protein [Actibacterium pelagium]GGE49962.1 hypothetical protein GCM10011517_17170 [Actibacterium pelagium]